MKALCWHGTGKVQVDNVPDPKIEDPRDIIVKITASGICGSDLHLLDALIGLWVEDLVHGLLKRHRSTDPQGSESHPFAA